MKGVVGGEEIINEPLQEHGVEMRQQEANGTFVSDQAAERSDASLDYSEYVKFLG